MAAEVVYIGNDNLLTVTGLRNSTAAAGVYINDATVTVTLKEKADGSEVAGDTWPKALSYVSDSDGVYRATLKDTLTLSNKKEYTAEVTANGGSDLLAYWEFDLEAQTRTS